MNLTSYNCIIVDDEPKAIELLSDSLKSINPQVTITNTYTSWTKALEGLRHNACDILFLDVSMQGRNGMDLLRCLPDFKGEVIMVTGHREYALDAFQLAVSGYVLKPVNEVELAGTLNNTIKRVKSKQPQNTISKNFTQKIGIPGENAIHYINLSEIIYFEALNSYTKIYTTKEQIISSYNLGKFKEMVDSGAFFQVHRSYVVNLNRIKKYMISGTVLMDNNMEIPVSKNIRPELSRLLKAAYRA